MSSSTALHFEVGKSSETAEEKPPSQDHALQYIPASVDFNGKEEVDVYFTNFIRTKTDGAGLEATLRGRPLDGEALRLPDGHEAVVMQAVGGGGISEDGHEDSQRSYRAVKKTTEITYWNYDKAPSDDDQFKKALHWMKLAKVMHEEE